MELNISICHFEAEIIIKALREYDGKPKERAVCADIADLIEYQKEQST